MRWLILIAALFLIPLCFNIVTAQTVIPTQLSTSSTMVNGTQFVPVYIPPPQAQEVQAVAEQTDNNSIMSVLGILFTGTIAPFIVKLIKDYNTGKKEHDTNVFRLEATSSAIQAANESQKATDDAAYDHARVTQAILEVMCQKKEIKDMFNAKKIDGIGLVDYMDRFVASSEQDLKDYYDRNDLPKDDFDTCNDRIVQQVTAARNKSRK